MESNDELKEIDIKNCTYYYFYHTIQIEGFDFDNILIGEKLFESILVYDISYKSLIGAKLLLISFHKVDGFIKVYDGTRYLVFLEPEKHDAIFNRIRHLITQESSTTNVVSHNYTKNKTDLNDSLPLEKISTLPNAITLTKSVFNEDQNQYYYNIFLEKCSYKYYKYAIL